MTKRMTALEFLALEPNGVRDELVRGEVIVNPSPSLGHSYVVTRLLLLLGVHADENGLGEILFNLDAYFGPDDVRRPDLLFYVAAQQHVLSADEKPHEPPDLCVEVLSPPTIQYDRTEKFDLYQAAGVRFYWIVDPMERTLEAYKLVNGIYVLSGHGSGSAVLKLPPFEDLEIPLATLWRPTIPTQP